MTPAALPSSVAFLREELVRAAARRRARGRSLVATIGVLLGACALLVATRPVPALADVAVDVRDGRLLVRLVDLEHRPEHIEGVLRGLGLDASVVDAPVGPSRVGRFVGTLDEGLHAAVRRLGAAAAGFEGFSVPVGWTGHLDLRVGRPASPGESYAVFSDALAPGEPLACRPLLGRSAGEVLAELGALDLEVLVQAGSSALRTPAAVLRGPQRHARVRAVDAASAHRVIVRLGPPVPGATRAAAPECSP